MKVKNTVILPAVVLIALFTGTDGARGQASVVNDPILTALTQANADFEATQFAQELSNHLEMIANLESSLEQFKGLNTIASGVYNAAGAVHQANVLTGLYDEYQSYVQTVGRATTIGNQLAGRGVQSAWDVYDYYQRMQLVTDDVLERMDFIKYILNMKNGLKFNEIVDYVNSAKDTIRHHRYELERRINEIDEAYAKAKVYVCDREAMNAMIYGDRPQIQASILPHPSQIDFSSTTNTRTVASAVDDELSGNTGNKTTGSFSEADANAAIEQSTRSVNTSAKSVFNLVSVLVIILMMIYALANFTKVVKGDRQAQDGLLKVFAGGGFAILLLQVIKLIIS